VVSLNVASKDVSPAQTQRKWAGRTIARLCGVYESDFVFDGPLIDTRHSAAILPAGLECDHERPALPRRDHRLLSRYLRPRSTLRAPHAVQSAGGQTMTWIYVIGAIVALGLFIYLLCALLKPEWFQ
jgi:K+-transporting ATPase KdpF subunit